MDNSNEFGGTRAGWERANLADTDQEHGIRLLDRRQHDADHLVATITTWIDGAPRVVFSSAGFG